MIYNTINGAYVALINRLVTQGKRVGNTLELQNYKFKLMNLNNNICTARDLSLKYLCGEFLWYFNGRNDLEFISQYASFWKRISDDGIHSNSAYGDILFNRHGFNQVEKIIELLTQDPDSRRGVLNFNVPNENVIETKDEICTIALTFSLRENKLNATTIMRSNDIYYGLPYDVAFFTELQKYVAMRLGVEYGWYEHMAISMHMYDRNYEDIFNAITNTPYKNIRINIKRFMDLKDSLIVNPDNIVTTFYEKGILYEY